MLVLCGSMLRELFNSPRPFSLSSSSSAGWVYYAGGLTSSLPCEGRWIFGSGTSAGYSMISFPIHWHRMSISWSTSLNPRPLATSVTIVVDISIMSLVNRSDDSWAEEAISDMTVSTFSDRVEIVDESPPSNDTVLGVASHLRSVISDCRVFISALTSIKLAEIVLRRS